MTHIPPFREWLGERAVPFDDILEPSTNQGLVSAGRTRNGTLTVRMAIYDFDDARVLAYFAMKCSGGDDFFEVHNVFAEQGYGPDAYDLALMHAYPKAVKPDVIIKPAALSVWRYYLARRPDVRRAPLDPRNGSYASAYAEDAADDLALRDPGTLALINTKFYLPRSPAYARMAERGASLCREFGESPLRILDAAERQFKSVYLGR